MSQVDQDGYEKAANGEKKPLPPLNRLQINYARQLIENKHPLKTAHISHVWGFMEYFSWFTGKPKTSFKVALKKSLRHKLDLKMPSSELMVEGDPFLRMGFGMNAYFDIVKQLLYMFIFITIFAIPSMMIFSSYDGLQKSPTYAFDMFSVGNMGGSSIACSQTPLTVRGAVLTLTCPTGFIDSTAMTKDNQQAFQTAVIPSNALAGNYCTAAAIEVPEGSDSAAICDSWLDNEAVQRHIADSCDGKSSCALHFLNADGSFNDKFFHGHTSPSAQCDKGAAQIMVSTGCMLGDVASRQVKGLLVGCISISITLFVVVYLDFIRQIAKNNFVEWDVKTVTAGDFSIEFDISKDFYEAFVRLHGSRKPVNETMAMFFRDWMTKEMESRLTIMPDLGFEEEPPQTIKIAVTTFAFDNADLILLLRERGAAITADNFDRMKEIDAQINQLKDEKLEKFVRPCSVFMTFESEEGLQRALKFDECTNDPSADQDVKDQRIWLGDKVIEIQPASEPSDIIWENRHFTPTQRFRKSIIVILTIGFALLCSFVVVFFCRQYQADVAGKYPLVDCAPYTENYPGETLRPFASQEYTINTKREEEGKTTQYVGYLSCYCQAQAAEGQLPDKEYRTQNGKQVLCQQYWNYQWLNLAITNAITGFIVVVNTILSALTISLITWIGYDTHSEMLTKITNGVFVAQFFNTGIIYLLVNANFKDALPPLASIFRGPFLDYEPAWYSAVGYLLVQTMLINAFFPPIMQVIADVQAWLFRRMDQSWEKDPREAPYKTKCTQVSQYVTMYSGPEYIVHFKYSSVFNVTFVTMMYGVGLPILYPIAVLTYLIFWVHEKYHMAYTYQLPPSLDDKLTDNAISILRYAPILLLFNGFWMLDNQQIFESVINLKETSLSLMSTGHTLATVRTVSQASPLLLLGMAVFFIFILQMFFAETLEKYGFGFSETNIEVDENLPNFFKAVKLSEADWITMENSYYKESYKMPLIMSDTAIKLDETEQAKKPIQGIHWYNLLANPTYAQQFAYIGVNTEDRANLIVDDDDCEENDCEQSDMVQLILNMAFISDGFVKELKFGPGISKQMKGINLGQGAVSKFLGNALLNRGATDDE